MKLPLLSTPLALKKNHRSLVFLRTSMVSIDILRASMIISVLILFFRPVIIYYKVIIYLVMNFHIFIYHFFFFFNFWDGQDRRWRNNNYQRVMWLRDQPFSSVSCWIVHGKNNYNFANKDNLRMRSTTRHNGTLQQQQEQHDKWGGYGGLSRKPEFRNGRAKKKVKNQKSEASFQFQKSKR